MQEKTLLTQETRTSNIHSSEFGAISYDIFGSPYQKTGSFLADDSLDFGYLGKPYNSDTELYDYGFRDYSPEIARFSSVDPIRDGRNWYCYVVNDPVNYVDLWGLQCKSESDGENRIAIIGWDDSWGVRKSFYEAAINNGYNIASTSPVILFPLFGNYGATKSGKDAINALKEAGENTPITEIFFSTHGVPYAIDFFSGGNNLYVDNVANFIDNFSPGKEAAYVSDLSSLVDEGFISDDVTIILAGCNNGASPDSQKNSTNKNTKKWATSEDAKNMAQEISIAIPNATVIASTTQVDSAKGIINSVTYKNGVVVDEK